MTIEPHNTESDWQRELTEQLAGPGSVHSASPDALAALWNCTDCAPDACCDAARVPRNAAWLRIARELSGRLPSGPLRSGTYDAAYVRVL